MICIRTIIWLHVPGILNPNTGGKSLYGELSVHIRAPILNSDSNVLSYHSSMPVRLGRVIPVFAMVRGLHACPFGVVRKVNC